MSNVKKNKKEMMEKKRRKKQQPPSLGEERTQDSCISPLAVCHGFSEKQGCQHPIFLCWHFYLEIPRVMLVLARYGERWRNSISPAENLSPGLKGYVHRMLVTSHGEICSCLF